MSVWLGVKWLSHMFGSGVGVLFHGQLWHAGSPVVAGQRYLLVASFSDTGNLPLQNLSELSVDHFVLIMPIRSVTSNRLLICARLCVRSPRSLCICICVPLLLPLCDAVRWVSSAAVSVSA